MSRYLSEAQQRVHKWCVTEWNGEYWPPLGNLARLVEEVGELARLVNDRYGYKLKKASEPSQDLEIELGDILFTLIAFANSTGVNLDRAFDAVMQKYAHRDMGRYRAAQQDADGTLD
ncbi:MAG: nucleotide pyrophosphohydrolase [Chloroflexi bacterium]|nr:nucleotide pyrophosphohydrolase [Chloroflexota bacterium]